jgi:GcrA cell cycle regulator
VSNCSRSSAQALLQSVQEMVQSLSELHDLRRRVREAEASFAKAKRLRRGGFLPDGVEKHFEAKPVPRAMRVGSEKKAMAKKLPSRAALNVIEPPLEMRPRSLLELNETDCHWPLGEVHEVAVLFCGASKEPVSPYCGHHLRMAQG